MVLDPGICHLLVSLCLADMLAMHGWWQLLSRPDPEMRCTGAKLLSLMLRGKLGNKSDPGVEMFLANDGLSALQSCLEQEASCREVEMGGLWLRERGGARVYVQELMEEIQKLSDA